MKTKLAVASFFALLLVPFAALAQGGTCRPGVNCTSASFTANGAGATPLIIKPNNGTTVAVVDNGGNATFIGSVNVGGLSASANIAASGYILTPTPIATGPILFGAGNSGISPGSFPTCNGTTRVGATVGGTDGQLYVCTGAGGWKATSIDLTAPTVFWSSMDAWGSGEAAAEGANFIGPYVAKGIVPTPRIFALSCSWGVVGTGGATGIVAEIYDVTAAASVCTCNLGACTTAIRTPKDCSCTNTPSGANHSFAVRFTTATDCTVNPGRVLCNVEAQ